ncbi:hypothetical protein [Neolewinella persica]|uniref:hypothetical protein n=1 Tax=Neolewinella persica TaxID=70998 RepID=UPI0003A780AE|nr:hypothetical protein [Neolewinella persica]
MPTTTSSYPTEDPGNNPEEGLRNKMQGSRDRHYTAGFTIPGIYNLLPSSSSTDTDLIGWMFLFPTGGTTVPMKQIEIKKLWKSTQNGFSVLFTEDFISADFIIPHICTQAPRTYSSQHSIDYIPALALTQTVFTPRPEGLDISDLSHHRTWAEASFVRRTDLDILRLYLDPANGNGYNDVFFSGAEVRYSTMHNPRLRVQQHNYPSPPPIYDSGHAFTLKAEPFDVTAVAPPPPVQEGDLIDQFDPIEGTVEGVKPPQVSTQVPAAKAPGAFMMIPCPDFWEVSQGIAAAMAEGDFWFGFSLIPKVQEQLSPAALRTLITTRQKVNTVESSIVLEVANFIRTTFGNTPN